MNIPKVLARSVCTFLILTIAICAYLPLQGSSQADFFSQPKLCSAEELAEELKTKTLGMSWHFGPDSDFRFVSENDEVYLEVYLRTLPKSSDGLVARIKDKFITSVDGKTLVFSYHLQGDGKEELNRPRLFETKQHPDDDSYIVTDRRVFERANPKSMSRDELAAIISDKKILFYTGAGVSLASDIPAMNELSERLGLEEKERFIFSLEKALDNPRAFALKIREFHKACLFSVPTPAHFALKDLAIFKKIRIVTENLDSLHEASGISAYRVNAHQVREEIGGDALSQFDYIICVGLSFDDRGFLGWYKQQNPQGKIISIDLKQPFYLGDEDFLVMGDIQEVIPAIKKALL